MKRLLTNAALLALFTAGCAPQDAAPGVASNPRAAASLLDATGRQMGQARVEQQGGDLKLTLQLSGLPAGPHGVHLHAVGRCDAPDFATAGPHWNPTSRQHGKDNPAGMHRGDMPNAAVAADGSGRLEAVVAGATLAELLDADGAALVVHAGADDYRTDPSGNSGGRIACGVLSAS